MKQKLGRYRRLLGVLCIGLALALVIFLKPQAVLATNPATMSFQGKVVNSDGTNVNSGTSNYSIVFRIYNTSSPTMTTSCTSTASCLWQETQGTVSVTNGIFQVELGSSCALTSASCNNSAGGPINWSTTSSLYLTMQFNGDTSGSNGGFMSPLIHIQSIPFAFNADQLGGLSSSGFIQNTTSPQSSSNFNISGTGVAGTALQTPLITTAASTDLQLQPTTGIVALNRASTDNELRVYENAASPSNYASITATASDATFKSNSGTTKIGNGTGAITINAGAGSAVNITGHDDSTWETDAGSITLQAAAASTWSTVSGNLTLQAGSGTVSLGSTTLLTASGAISVQGGSTLALLADSGSAITIGGGTGDTGSVTFAASTREPTLNSAARHTRRLTFVPEYPGATLTGDGSNNSGTMTSDNETTSPFRNFYSWTVSGGTSNDYDIWVRFALPADFSDFTSSDALTIEGWSSNTANTALDIVNVYDDSGTARCSSSVSFEPGSNSTWGNTTTNQTCTDTGFASANDMWTVRIRLTASSSASARVGRFYITYLSKW